MRSSNVATEADQPRLALRRRDAAKQLGVSERLLWDWTNDGVIPYVRIGRTILYPTDGLRDWLRDQSQSQPAERNEHETN